MIPPPLLSHAHPNRDMGNVTKGHLCSLFIPAWLGANGPTYPVFTQSRPHFKLELAVPVPQEQKVRWG